MTTATVTPQEFGSKVAQVITLLSQTFGNIILPFASLAMIVSIVLFIAGSLFHSSTVRRMGIAGIMSVVLGVILYFSIPLIFALLRSISQPLNISML